MCVQADVCAKYVNTPTYAHDDDDDDDGDGGDDDDDDGGEEWC